MTAPVAVDVREVLAELLSFEERHAEYEPRANHEGREAIAAVAELIEAVDNAISEWEAGHDDFGPMDYLRHVRARISAGAAP